MDLWAHGNADVDVAGQCTFTARKYKCPRHGEIDGDVITSMIKGHEGSWCMRCIFDAMEHLYICKAEKI